MHNFVGTEEWREALVECDEAIAFGAVGLVADDAVGKVAAASEHRKSLHFTSHSVYT